MQQAPASRPVPNLEGDHATSHRPERADRLGREQPEQRRADSNVITAMDMSLPVTRQAHGGTLAIRHAALLRVGVVNPARHVIKTPASAVARRPIFMGEIPC